MTNARDIVPQPPHRGNHKHTIMTTNNTHRDDAPALWVGTYAKYNDYENRGEWLYLEDYADAEEFMEACHKLHNDEADPEFMFADFENFPDSLYHESMGESGIQQIYDWMELDEDTRAKLEAYESIHGAGDGDISDRAEAAEDAYFCSVSAWRDWNDVAMEYVDAGCFGIEIPEALQRYFDWDVLAGELKMEMSMADNGMVFWDR